MKNPVSESGLGGGEEYFPAMMIEEKFLISIESLRPGRTLRIEPHAF